MGTDKATLVLEMIQAVEQRDGGRLLEIYDPDVEFTWPPEPPYGGTYRGHEVIGMSEVFAAAWESLQRTDHARRFDPRVLGVNGDEVAVLYHQRADTPDGGLWETEVVGLYTVVDGQVVRLQMLYFDPRAPLRSWPRRPAEQCRTMDRRDTTTSATCDTSETCQQHRTSPARSRPSRITTDASSERDWQR